MPERLHFILGVMYAKVPIVVLNLDGESLKEEGVLTVIICALCDAPSRVTQEISPILLMVRIVLTAAGTSMYVLYWLPMGAIRATLLQSYSCRVTLHRKLAA